MRRRGPRPERLAPSRSDTIRPREGLRQGAKPLSLSRRRTLRWGLWTVSRGRVSLLGRVPPPSQSPTDSQRNHQAADLFVRRIIAHSEAFRSSAAPTRFWTLGQSFVAYMETIGIESGPRVCGPCRSNTAHRSFESELPSRFNLGNLSKGYQKKKKERKKCRVASNLFQRAARLFEHPFGRDVSHTQSRVSASRRSNTY